MGDLEMLAGQAMAACFLLTTVMTHAQSAWKGWYVRMCIMAHVTGQGEGMLHVKLGNVS